MLACDLGSSQAAFQQPDDQLDQLQLRRHLLYCLPFLPTIVPSRAHTQILIFRAPIGAATLLRAEKGAS